MLLYRRCHSNVLDVQSFRRADCDVDHCLVVAEVRERLSVTKQETHKFCMGRFSLKKSIKVEHKGQYHVTISERVVSSELRSYQGHKQGFGKKLPYILESNPHLVFADFLNEKMLVPASNPHLSFNRPLPTRQAD